MTARYSGSCLCGDVRFEIDGEFERFFLCHCQRCRKGSGTAHAANLFSSSARIRWLSGQDNVRDYTVPATRHVTSFCTACGSQVPYLDTSTGSLEVPAGCLDTALAIIPDAHIFMSDKADWDTNLESVPMFDQRPR